MAFRLKRSESLQQAVRRIAREQWDTALRDIEGSAESPETAVHETRKRCKKVRGLLRLVRPGFEGAYRRENAAARDIARRLALVRDIAALQECAAGLAECVSDEEEKRALSALKAILDARAAEAADPDEQRRRLAEAREAILDARERAAAWTLDSDGPEVALAGFRKLYSQARAAMKSARAQTDAERLHEWRKRAKYHWHHLRLLRRLWLPVVEREAEQADELSERLGGARDLERLEAALRQSWRQGARLFAEKPKPRTRRMAAYWKAWQSL